jgi:peroxiredoxin
MNTEILLIINCEEYAVKNLQQLLMMPFPLLSDGDDRISKQFLGTDTEHRPALFIIDRYGSIWNYYVTRSENIDIKLQKVMKWLEFIETQCPECDIKDEPEINENIYNLPFIKKMR